MFRLILKGTALSMALIGGTGCFSGWSDTADTGYGQSDNGDFLFTIQSDAGYEDWSDWVSGFGDNNGSYLNSAFGLPYDLEVAHDVCGMQNAYWDGVQIVLCYEMLTLITDLFWNSGWGLDDSEYSDLTYWSWTFILYHELGHALIDMYDLPVPGREEDAVDSFSAVVLILGGVPDAVVQAALFWFLLEDHTGGTPNFVDEHSMNMQRFYNLMCWVYGSDPVGYSYIVDSFPEMGDRVAGGRCESEYQDQQESWMQLLEPWLK